MEKELVKEDNDKRSRFYVQKKAFFSWGRKILTIYSDRIELDAIPLRADQKEIIYFCDFAPIQLSDKNDKELTLGSTKTKVSMLLSTTKRALLLNEIYKNMDVNNSKPDSDYFLEVECSGPVEGSNGGNEELLKFKIFRTHFQIEYLDIVTSNFNQYVRTSDLGKGRIEKYHLKFKVPEYEIPQ